MNSRDTMRHGSKALRTHKSANQNRDDSETRKMKFNDRDRVE